MLRGEIFPFGYLKSKLIAIGVKNIECHINRYLNPVKAINWVQITSYAIEMQMEGYH